MKALQTDEGDPDPIAQRNLEKKMGFSHHSGIGQLVYAMVCCCPDLSFATVKLSQHNTIHAPAGYTLKEYDTPSNIYIKHDLRDCTSGEQLLVS